MESPENVATILLGRLLEFHFDLIFPKVEAAVRSNPLFAHTVKMCWKLGQAKEPSRAQRLDHLKKVSLPYIARGILDFSHPKL